METKKEKMNLNRKKTAAAIMEIVNRSLANVRENEKERNERLLAHYSKPKIVSKTTIEVADDQGDDKDSVMEGIQTLLIVNIDLTIVTIPSNPGSSGGETSAMPAGLLVSLPSVSASREAGHSVDLQSVPGSSGTRNNVMPAANCAGNSSESTHVRITRSTTRKYFMSSNYKRRLQNVSLFLLARSQEQCSPDHLMMFATLSCIIRLRNTKRIDITLPNIQPARRLIDRFTFWYRKIFGERN